ncbi:hypothetical protein ACS0TY_017643 [Phlomoides rotata]
MAKELGAILMVFYLSICSAASLNMSNTDMSSLLALKSGFNSHILANNWSQETSFCTWIGVTCSPSHLRVTGLDLSRMGLRGTIAGEIGNLSSLTFLNMSSNQLSDHIPETIGLLKKLNTLSLSYNYLSGNIPLSFGNLSQLQVLNLTGNQLTGEFPSAVIRCHSLKTLHLGANKFTGNIPAEFWNLSAIQRLDLSRNNFTGTIPPSVANFTNLVVFILQGNSFHGTIPSEIGQLSSLTFLDLGANKLNGIVPQSIFNFSRLQSLQLGENTLSGNLPFWIDKGLPNIQEIVIRNNQFNGNIPSSISNLSKLTLLSLSFNSFTGHIPITLGNLPQLQSLSLVENQFTNNLSVPEQDFLSSLTACNYLETIRVSANPITGVLPKSLGSGNLSASLQTFLAQECRIRSPVPNEIGNLSNLMWLTLGYNDLTGPIPAAFGYLRNLQKLGMYGNKLEGSIPHVICNLENMYSLELDENNLVGQLPICLGNLSLMREINLAANAFNFSIPPSFCLNEHVERINLSSNFLHGSVPGEIGNMKALIELDLSKNQISGEIPTSISQLQNLINLSLSNNKLVGPVIESFSDLKELQHLDLSKNNLSGPIPKSLDKIASLAYFNVSFNDLSGEIPDTGPFANFTAESFTGNKGLCGASRFKVKECQIPKSSSEKKLFKYILPVIAFVVVAAIILVLVLRKQPSVSPFELPLVFGHERISYHEILHATNNLDEGNLIGRGSFGSVYRGIFPDASVAAVKVFNLDVQGAFKSFDTECQILRSIRHRNLVKVITSCSNVDFKALVMEYMPNGNLESWLYSDNCSLNIFQRLGIMINVACAVEYLHEGYTFPIVHCDLKPNNILLDEDMVAHVADFGIAKLFTQEQRMQQTGTLGTIGYIAPEYGTEGLVSTMVDVYSYGILLMEVFSRRKPTDEMFSGELTMRRWVSESFPNSVMQIVDHELLNMDDERSRGRHERCLTSVMEVAVECTADLAEERPSMKDVVARMNRIYHNQVELINLLKLK